MGIVRDWLRIQYERWLQQRLPAKRTVTLDRQRLLVFPSAAGFAYLLVVMVLLLLAINYQNNMIYALALLLLSLMVVAILHTWSNLSGLTLSSLQVTPVFVGDPVCFKIRLSRPMQTRCHAITLAWPGQDAVTVSLLTAHDIDVVLALPSRQRGLFRADRLLLESHYPLGLVRCWSWIDLALEALVYPQPLAARVDVVSGAEAACGDPLVHLDSDDYFGLRDYQVGDSLKQVAWKHYARGHDLYTREFAIEQGNQLWLDYAMMAGDVEMRLSALCFEALKLAANDASYGLRLPGLEIEPNRGDQHRHKVLQALALFHTGSS